MTFETSLLYQSFDSRGHPQISGSRRFDISRVAQSTIPFTRDSICSLVFPACKHTLTRSNPFGTVGQVIGRAFRPLSRRCADSGRGADVMTGIIGESDFG